MHPLIQSLLTPVHSTLNPHLSTFATIPTDGAWGTQLQVRGLALGACPDEWNLTRPELVEEVAHAYVSAGSRIILTNTFGANRLRLADFSLAHQTRALNERGVAISKRAAGNQALVFASIGPSGKMLSAGDVTEEIWQNAFTEQAQALRDGGADGLVIETMSDLVEAKAALTGAQTTGLPVVVSLSFDTNGRTLTGITPAEAATALTKAGADVIGSNCGNGIAAFVPICRQLRAATTLPIWIKANAGLPEYENGKLVYPITPKEFASYVPALQAAGANFIGGCCGTAPAHLKAIIARLDDHCLSIRTTPAAPFDSAR